MIRGNLLIAFMLFATGILTSISSYFYGLGSLSEPSAGTFPFGIGIALMGCSTSLVISSLKKLKNNNTDIPVWAQVNFTKVSMILGALLLYVILLNPLGFLACSFIIQLLLFKVAGGKPWLWSVIATTITILVVYLVFFLGLGVYVPLFPDWIY